MPLMFAKSLIQHRHLMWQLTRRSVLGRYRGSLLGWGWSLTTPLMMLGIYSFVFSTVFKTRWGQLEQAGPLGFAINLFAGLIVFNLVAECINEAPSLVVSNANYVTKVIFPLEILGATTVATALFHACTSVVILIIFELVALHSAPLSIFWLPFVWLPLILGCLGVTWLLSALGVFFRDLGQLVGVFVTMLMFLSTVFYPLSALPPSLQPWLALNPLVLVIEQSRMVLVQGAMPSQAYVLLGSLTMLMACELSYRLFCKARRGFADVL